VRGKYELSRTLAGFESPSADGCGRATRPKTSRRLLAA
jgi:hypothetical protein